MTIGDLATPFVVPPVNLALGAVLALLAGRRRLAGLALVGLLLLAVPLVADGLLRTLEHAPHAAILAGDERHAQAIVTLGAEVIHQTDGRTVPGALSLQRLRTAAALARLTGLPLLVSGGVTQAGAAPVAMAMADSLREDFGVAPRWIESRSADTFENAFYSAAILESAGVGDVLVVTHSWHMPRALQAFRAAGLHAIPAPVPPSASNGVSADDIIPRVSAWLTSYYALHEWIGSAWYQFLRRAPAAVAVEAVRLDAVLAAGLPPEFATAPAASGCEEGATALSPLREGLDSRDPQMAGRPYLAAALSAARDDPPQAAPCRPVPAPVDGGRATVLKLAHDEAANARRQRKGLILARPWRPRGAAAALETLRTSFRAASRPEGLDETEAGRG